MPRERWFFAENGERRGPLGFGPLLSALVQEREPRSVLVWRRGFAEWTRAEDVPEVEQRLAPLLARPTGGIRRLTAHTSPPPAQPALRAESRASLFGRTLAAGLVVLALVAAGVVGWKLATRPEPLLVPLPDVPRPSAPALPASTAAPPPTTVAAAPARVAATRRPPPALPFADREARLPAAELRKLRGVAAWSGAQLRLTVNNGTAWRVTELAVRVGRFVGDDFVYDPQPLGLLPPAGAVDTGVADLLKRVVPDRMKPGVNPLDTGVFEGRAGAAPESFRWEIESARGYPPAASAEPGDVAPR